MATLTLNFTNASPSPSNGYRVRYRLKGSGSAYTTLTPNPSASPAIITGVDANSNYEGTVESDCGGFFSSVATFSTCTCPEGYSRNPENTSCFIVDTVAATPPTGGTALNTESVQGPAYSTCGSYIYNTGFATDGTGASTQISLTNAFWRGGSGNCIDAQPPFSGPLNRTGLWVHNTTDAAYDNQRIGFSVCLNLDETTTYYIGIAGDNLPTIRIDGATVVNMNATALGAQYSVGASATFKVWHIYPVTLSSGPHNIELTCMNITSIASLGAEVYKMPASRFAQITSYNDFAAGELVFSTKDFIGMPAQLGTGGSGYTCPSGYSLSTCDGTPNCKKILTATCT